MAQSLLELKHTSENRFWFGKSTNEIYMNNLLALSILRCMYFNNNLFSRAHKFSTEDVIYSHCLDLDLNDQKTRRYF